MILTGILKPGKRLLFWVFVVSAWVIIAYAGYQVAPSKAKADWNQIHRSVVRAAEWNSYQVEEFVETDGIEQLHLSGKIQQQPKQSFFEVQVKLKEDHFFSFEAYLTANRIDLHNKEQDHWVQMDINHPAAGELTGMSNPIEFWKNLLSSVKTIKKVQDVSKVGFHMTLRTFFESVHGIAFEGDSAEMEIWIDKEKGNLLEAKLKAKLPQNTHYNYKEVEYRANFTGVNQTNVPNMP
ncbi:hypothetical protein [Effusibacillus lacus]|uniref:Uncharacterized protein n=1 Tax=Effusibacillus lacus TaxID=1348429 RepID=A0A292YI86_9BACL|nr:hypothetical protein [Effusibacillus lacus]TCS74760.1 hypothetical protein EDD64_11149 [Effusibacillus lacus]GAX88571.1 hypothetical protein EFBL_0183 [Effusibacillus lacus]